MNKNTLEKSFKSKWGFEIPPAPIPDDLIKEEVNAEIVVVGAGVSGLPAALSAAQQGAKTVILEKYNKVDSPGFATAVTNCKLQKKLGIKVDLEDLVKKLVIASEGRADARIIQKWANLNSEVMDWLIDISEKAGVFVKVDKTTLSFGKGTWMEDEQVLLSTLTREIRNKGVNIYFNTPAVRLTRPGLKGRVTGVIAQNHKGEYIRFNAAKAVILCTGDYGNNPEMIEKYVPWATGVGSAFRPGTNTGDGHKIALWIGAAPEEPPHCTMIHFNASGNPIGHSMGPFLCVNKFGERIQNESLPMEFIARKVIRQPEKAHWQIFDAQSLTDENREAIQKAIDSGAIMAENTLEALAKRFGANTTTFISTINRYNDLVRARKDTDFGKGPEWLVNTIEKPPFCAYKFAPGLLAIMGGIKRNIDGQVLDTNLKVIPGLYVAGNIASGFWGDTYPLHVIGGISRSHALTFGRLAGLHAAVL